MCGPAEPVVDPAGLREDKVKKTVALYSALAIAALLFFGSFAIIGMDPHHDGVMLIPALRVAGGAAVFRDVYCQYGLLTPLLQGAAVALFGPELVVIRLLTAVFYAGSAVLLDLVWRRFLTVPGRVAMFVMFFGLAPELLVTFHPWSSVYALFFMLLGLQFQLMYCERGCRILLAVAGGAAALAFLSRHPCGAAAAVAAVAALAWRAAASGPEGNRWRFWWKETLTYSAGFAVPVLAAAIYISITGGWRDFFIQCLSFVGRFAWERGGGGDWPQIAETMLPFITTMGIYDVFFGILPLVTVGLLLAVVWGCRSDRNRAAAATGWVTVLLLGAASWHQYYPVPCVRHLYWAAVPMLGAYVALGEKLFRSRRQPGWRRWFLLFLLVVPPALGIWVRGYFWKAAGRMPWRMNTVPELPGLRGMRLNREEGGVIEILEQAGRDPVAAGRGVFNFTSDPLFSVLLPESALHHPMFMRMLNIQAYADYDQAALRFIYEHRPLVLADADTPELTGYATVGRFALRGRKYLLLAPRELVVLSGPEAGGPERIRPVATPEMTE